MASLLIVLAGIAAVLIHESGHYLTACAFGIRTKGFVVNRKGIAIIRERGPWFDCMVVSLAGPALNLLFAAFSSGPFALANLCMGFVNLIPMQGSDGSRVLECLYRIENHRTVSTRLNGYVDPIQLSDLIHGLDVGKERFNVSVKTQADAEKLYERLLHAGADTSRVTICVI